jgi:heme A synthase
VRTGALVSGALILVEALIGAALVRLSLVGSNDSVARAVVIGLHLVNTFLLLGALTLTAWWASGGPGLRAPKRSVAALALFLGLVGIVLVAMTGAITALGDTLFPASSLSEGLAQDTSPTAHVLVQLRVVHPALAIVVGALILALTWFLNESDREVTRKLAGILRILVVAQLLAGVVNIALLVPIWMQLVHLLLADLVWISLVMFAAARLAVETPTARQALGSSETFAASAARRVPDNARTP